MTSSTLDVCVGQADADAILITSYHFFYYPLFTTATTTITACAFAERSSLATARARARQARVRRCGTGITTIFINALLFPMLIWESTMLVRGSRRGCGGAARASL